MVNLSRPKGIFILDESSFDLIYNREHRETIAELVDIIQPNQTSETILNNYGLLTEVDMVFSGWGGPTFDADFLSAAQNLKMVFYGAGSIRGYVTELFWKRGIRITSAYAANAVPVVEYTLAQIILCLKRAYQQVAIYRQEKRWVRLPVPGAYQSTVGIISLGMIGQMLARKLQDYDLKVIAYDPFMDPQQALNLNVQMVSLEEVFQLSDVVTLHTPWLLETEGMITGDHLKMMRPQTAFINTARGAVVKEKEMIEVLQKRPDIFAVIDVTHPEPPEYDSPLYYLPNVFLTPHIAGSMDRECERMGQIMVDELDRYLNGLPLLYEISEERSKIMA
jgi:phosphoglycerate dehydrogenase-like enzyme